MFSIGMFRFGNTSDKKKLGQLETKMGKEKRAFSKFI